MADEARVIVSSGAGGAALEETRTAFMRYAGQGHEIAVPLSANALTADHAETIRAAFESAYKRLYGRVIPGPEPEILSWTLTMTAPRPHIPVERAAPSGDMAETTGKRDLFDPALGNMSKPISIGVKACLPVLPSRARRSSQIPDNNHRDLRIRRDRQ